MTEEERKENLKKISTAIDGIEARLREIRGDTYVTEENDDAWTACNIAIQMVQLLRSQMDIIEWYALERED